MKKLILIVFVILIAFAILWQFKDCPHVLRRMVASVLHQKYVLGSDIRFHRHQITGYGYGPRGSTHGGSSVTSSDCVTVGWSQYKFPTPLDADEQFQEWLHKATRVIQLEHSNNTERAVFENSADEQAFHVISREDGSAIIVSIWSDSLDHALLYEKHEKAHSIQ